MESMSNEELMKIAGISQQTPSSAPMEQMSDEELMGIAGIPPKVQATKQENRQKALQNIEDLKIEQELNDFGIKNIARDWASMIPLAGGYVDNIEAYARAKSQGTDYKQELGKVRQNQRNYEKLVKAQGLGTARAIGNITGGFGAGMLLPGKAATTAGKMAVAGAEGAIEGAGFADEHAKAGGVIGGILGAGTAGALSKLPTRQANEIASKTGDIRKLASDNKSMNVLVRGIDASKKVANNIKEVADLALERSNDDVANLFKKGYGEDVFDIAGVTEEANKSYGEFIERFGKETLPVNPALPPAEKINSVINRLDLTPTGKKELTKAMFEAADDTGEDILSLNTLQTAKKKLDDRINFNVNEGMTSSNFQLKATKNKLNKLLATSFPGFKEVQQIRKGAFDITKAYDEGLNFSPTSKKSRLKIIDDSGRERVFKDWSDTEKTAFQQGVKNNLVNSILSKSDAVNAANAVSNAQELIKRTLPEKTASELIRGLRKESDIFANLKSLSSKARNKVQARGSLANILGENMTLRNAALPLAAGYVSPALGVGVLGAELAGKVGKEALDARTAGLALEGVQAKQFQDPTSSRMISRGTGEYFKPEE